MWGVPIASEKRKRAETVDFIGENLSTELSPFSFPVKEGHQSSEIKNVPISYAPHLWRKVKDMFEFNDDNRGYI